MPNVFLSGRIPAELNQKIDEFLAGTGETKTEMLAKAVAAYIGAEPPPLKVTGDRRIENLELEVAELKGAVQSLYEKLAMFTTKIETPQIELERAITPHNIIDNSDNTDNIEDIRKIDQTLSDSQNLADNSNNYIETEKANNVDNSDNNDNKLEVSSSFDTEPTNNKDKAFLEIDTAEVAKLTKLDAKKFTNLRYSFNQKFKKQNKPFPENKKLDCPIKMTPPSGVKIEEIPYDVFYVGQSNEGKHLWNLIPEMTVGEQIPFTFPPDNS